MRRMLILLPLFALLALLLVPPSSGSMRRPTSLEGTKWKVKVMPGDAERQAGEEEFEETIIFKGGKFRTSRGDKKGFKPVEYEEDTRGSAAGTLKFTAVQVNEKHGQSKWSGTSTADQISGDIEWTMKDGLVLHYTFMGEKMPEK